MQPDVYCRRLSLQVPVAVSVKTNQMADVFQAICSVAMNPCVLFAPLSFSAVIHVSPFTRSSSIPGGVEGSVTTGARIRTYLTFSALLSGVTLGVLIYRRGPGPGGFWAGLGGHWLGWASGRREL